MPRLCTEQKTLDTYFRGSKTAKVSTIYSRLGKALENHSTINSAFQPLGNADPLSSDHGRGKRAELRRPGGLIRRLVLRALELLVGHSAALQDYFGYSVPGFRPASLAGPDIAFAKTGCLFPLLAHGR